VQSWFKGKRKNFTILLKRNGKTVLSKRVDQALSKKRGKRSSDVHETKKANSDERGNLHTNLKTKSDRPKVKKKRRGSPPHWPYSV